jgi:hypothetical protein
MESGIKKQIYFHDDINRFDFKQWHPQILERSLKNRPLACKKNPLPLTFGKGCGFSFA